MAQSNIERIGILIPTFNRLAYLRESLDSVLSQTHKAFQIVVIDNGSTDGTSCYMQTLSDPRIRYVVNEENLGPIGSINKAIGLMTDGVSWCTILCDDDLLESNYIEQMLSFTARYGTLGVVYAPLKFIDSHGMSIREGIRGPEQESPLSYLAARSHNRRETYLSGVFFTRELFEKIGGYPKFSTGMGTDDAFIFHLGTIGGMIGCNWKTKAYIRHHDSAESMALSGGLIRHFRSLLEFQFYCCDVARANDFSEKDVAHWTTHKIKLWLNSELIKTIQADLSAKLAKRDERPVDDMRSLLTELTGYLSVRFRTDLLLYTRFGMLFENQRWYFLLWRIISF